MYIYTGFYKTIDKAFKPVKGAQRAVGHIAGALA